MIQAPLPLLLLSLTDTFLLLNLRLLRQFWVLLRLLLLRLGSGIIRSLCLIIVLVLGDDLFFLDDYDRLLASALLSRQVDRCLVASVLSSGVTR